MTTLDKAQFDALDQRKRTRLINSMSGFKSPNLIGTRSKDGISNLAIVSSAVHLGASPALMGFVFRPDTVQRDTLENIRETGKLTLNHVHEEIYQKAHQTSARYPRNQSEFEECQLTEEELDQWPAPYVKESRIKIALEKVREIPITENGTHFVIASVQRIYIPDDCWTDDGYVDIEKAGSLAVSGLDAYHQTKRISRLSYAKPEQRLKTIS